MSSFYSAVESGNIDRVRQLLDGGIDVNSKDNQGVTLLHWASAKDESIVRFLLERGADVNIKDKLWGVMPLHWASMEGHESIVRLLLDRGANVNAKSSLGYTPLHNASEKGHESVVRLLLDRGADVDAQDRLGRTPLHDASMSGRKSVVRLLLDHDADVTIKNDNGMTPLKVAHESVIPILKEYPRQRIAHHVLNQPIRKIKTILSGRTPSPPPAPPPSPTAGPPPPRPVRPPRTYLPEDVTKKIVREYLEPPAPVPPGVLYVPGAGAGPGPVRGGRKTRRRRQHKMSKPSRKRKY